MLSTPSSVNELMEHLAVALEHRDHTTLDLCEELVNSWLQGPTEQNTQLRLIHAVRAAIEELEE